jgi:predicted RNA-binding Zn-ribbon protein involved in translation (DUF1610 family)
MVYQTRRPISAEVEDTVYACRRCGAELIRTSVCQASRTDRSAEAA